ncbi:MAG: phage holin family protein [Actinobacteria bacterium]|nr:phage holin family protein [Actinomycetota bacterium]MCB9388761.1 phage holin family protein [Acidimicrobiia bacterium]
MSDQELEHPGPTWTVQQSEDLGTDVAEFREMLTAYVKQETVEPAKALGRYVGVGVAASALFGMAAFFLALGVLRLVQNETGEHLTGNLSWIPYLITVIVLLAIAAGAWLTRGRRTRG